MALQAIPAPGPKGYKATEILALAREHGVPGKLIKRTKTREHRAYAVEGSSAPSIVMAPAAMHTLPSDEVPAPVKLITCTPTPLNVWVLGRIANGRREFPNRLTATSSPHVRRCMQAGLVEVVRALFAARDHPSRGSRLRITDAGFVAVVDYIATHDGRFAIPDGPFTTEICE